MSFFALPKQLQYAAWIALGFAAWVTWDLSHWWSLKEDYSFGYIVPLFVAYVLYDRWPKIAAMFDMKPATAGATESPAATTGGSAGDAIAQPGTPRWAELLAFLGIAWGVLVFAVGTLYRTAEGHALPASMLMTVSFSWLVLVGAFFFADRSATGRPLSMGERLAFAGILLFPALVWIISAPLVSFAERAVSTFLLNKVARTVFWVFDVLGFTIERNGSVLRLPKGEVGVEEACSGIRSLTACLFAGSFLAATFLDKFWKKVLMVATALGLAFATNLLRSLFLTSWAYAYGSESIAGTVHDVTGYAVLGLTVVLLLCLIPIFNIKLEMDDPNAGDESTGDGSPDTQPVEVGRTSQD